MPNTSQQRQLAWIRYRIDVIVEGTEYNSQEKRIRATPQLEHLLEVVMESLPQEKQRLVQEVLKLYEHMWSSQ